VDQAEVEYPSFLLEERMQDLMEDLEKRVREEQRMTLQDYLKVAGQTLEDLQERLRPVADFLVRRMLVLGELAWAERLTVSNEEINQRIQALSTAWGDRAEAMRAQLEKSENREHLGAQILYEKVLDRLIAIAHGEPVPEPATGGENETP
jgi:trigger factor